MSRLAKKPIVIPSKVSVEHKGDLLTIKGSLGTLQHKLNSLVSIQIDNNNLTVTRKDDSNFAKAIQGTTFVLLSNHIRGVAEGFVVKLQLQGVGYKAKVNGNKLELTIGKSHPVEYLIPAGVKIETPTVTEIVVSGYDKQLVGQAAANIRRFKEPEPYKGKGIRYADEVIELKEAKKSNKK